MKDRRTSVRRRLLPRDGGRRADDPGVPPSVPPGFPCPFCAHPRTFVADTVPKPNRRGYRRRRECASCGKRFWTFETIDVV